MNICIKQIGLICLVHVLSHGVVEAQARFNAKIGAESWSFKDEAEMTGQSKHPGQMVGFDILVEDSEFMFVAGLQYHRISLINEDQSFSFDFSEHHHVHYFMIPVTAGYTFLKNDVVHLSILGGGEVVFFYDVDDNMLGFDNKDFYGVSTNLTAILHSELFSFLTAEVRYHYGLLPLLKNRDDSKLSGWTLGAGVRF